MHPRFTWTCGALLLFLVLCSGTSMEGIRPDETRNETSSSGHERGKQKYRRPYQLPPGYDKWLHPILRDGTDQRIHASVGILIHALRSVDELHEEITLELDLKVRWRDQVIQEFDKRTAADLKKEYSVPYISLDSSFLDNLRWPSIIFNDVVKITSPHLHTTIYPKPVQLRIYSGGLIQMTTRLVIKLYCPMDFTYYPADTQTCKIRIRSHSSSENEILLDWNGVIRARDNKTLPFDVFLADPTDGSFNKYLHSITKTSYTHPLVQLESPESYTVLEFSLSAKRKLSFHIMQTFVPSTFLILITWLAFFLPTSMLEVRIGIAMTTLLTLTAMFSSIKEYTPNVSYVKAIDIWVLTCTALVFLTLFEFAVLVWLRKTIEKNMERKDRKSMLNNVLIKWRPNLRSTLHSKVSVEEVDVTQPPQVLQKSKWLVYKKITKAADRYGILIVAGTFVLFNIVFWSWLLVKSGHFKIEPNFDNNAKVI